MGSIVKFNRDSHFQRIRAHYLDEKITLTDFEQKKLERMKYIFSLRLKNKYSKQQAINKCSSEYDVSMATAYRDYSLAMAMFGELDEVDNRGERIFLREEYLFLYQQLIKDRNWPEAKKVLDSYRELFDFTDRDGEIEPDKIAAHSYYMKISKKLENALINTIAGGVINLNDIDVEDIDFKEVKDEENER